MIYIHMYMYKHMCVCVRVCVCVCVCMYVCIYIYEYMENLIPKVMVAFLFLKRGVQKSQTYRHRKKCVKNNHHGEYVPPEYFERVFFTNKR